MGEDALDVLLKALIIFLIGGGNFFMRLKGVCYDVGLYMGMNWRPDFDSKIVQRELEIIKNDLHCNAVEICSLDIDRLTIAARSALAQGLEVWFSSPFWDKTPEDTLKHLTKAARAAEALGEPYRDRMVFILGGELTLFMKGILEGNSFKARLANPNLFTKIKAGEHNKPLNEFLKEANSVVRSFYHGKVSYASLVWEQVDWDLFDFVGVDHYRTKKLEDKYVEMLEPSFKHGKPVVITELGYATTHGGLGEEGLLLSSAGLGKSIINTNSQFLHFGLPLFGRLIRPHLNGPHSRDEHWQATKLVETLEILDRSGVDGVFISQFESQISPYSDNPHYDLDMASSSLVKYYGKGRHGKTYPDMNWEPKESFRAVADYYSKSV